MSNTPGSAVKVPPSAANYTAATLDPDLRSSINALLIKEGHVAKIQEHLLHKLHAHSSNWPTAVQDHAVALLRSGETTNFPALLKQVLDDVRAETVLARAANGDAPPKRAAVNGAPAAGGRNLAVPRAVLEDALKITRECLESVCEVDDEGSG